MGTVWRTWTKMLRKSTYKQRKFETLIIYFLCFGTENLNTVFYQDWTLSVDVTMGETNTHGHNAKRLT